MNKENINRIGVWIIALALIATAIVGVFTHNKEAAETGTLGLAAIGFFAYLYWLLSLSE